MQETFADLQWRGMLPSLLTNKLNLTDKNLRNLCAKILLRENGCWEWMGARIKGYGVIKIRFIRDTPLPVHRLCYETIHGPVSEDLDVHHKVEDGCIGRACCNPDHLKSIERREHLVELTPNSMAFIHSHATACSNGHAYTIETMRMSKRGRRCLICEREKAQRARDAKLATEGREKFKWRKENKKTHCKFGHALTLDNLYFQKGGTGGSCLTCRREYHLREKPDPFMKQGSD